MSDWPQILAALGCLIGGYCLGYLIGRGAPDADQGDGWKPIDSLLESGKLDEFGNPVSLMFWEPVNRHGDGAIILAAWDIDNAGWSVEREFNPTYWRPSPRNPASDIPRG